MATRFNRSTADRRKQPQLLRQFYLPDHGVVLVPPTIVRIDSKKAGHGWQVRILGLKTVYFSDAGHGGPLRSLKAASRHWLNHWTLPKPATTLCPKPISTLPKLRSGSVGINLSISALRLKELGKAKRTHTAYAGTTTTITTEKWDKAIARLKEKRSQDILARDKEYLAREKSIRSAVRKAIANGFSPN